MSLLLRRSPAALVMALAVATLGFLAPGGAARAAVNDQPDTAPALSAKAAAAKPYFLAPFACGQTWTYSHWSGEIPQALDFIRTDGSTYGAPVLASASGTATTHYQPGGAGNYVIIDHGGGWKTLYFHLSGFSVANGEWVSRGEKIGTTGSSGNTTGAHIHYEQEYYGDEKPIVLGGNALPYPGSYYQYYLTSQNCGGDDGGDDGGGNGCTAAGFNRTDYENDSYPVYYCNNYKGGYVMTRDGQKSAWLNAGQNWFVCQKRFDGWENPQVGGAKNDIWLYTQGDKIAETAAYDGWGWFPATKVSGGGNYDRIPGDLPWCSEVW